MKKQDIEAIISQLACRLKEQYEPEKIILDGSNSFDSPDQSGLSERQLLEKTRVDAAKKHLYYFVRRLQHQIAEVLKVFNIIRCKIGWVTVEGLDIQPNIKYPCRT